jgi:hypothetical protein
MRRLGFFLLGCTACLLNLSGVARADEPDASSAAEGSQAYAEGPAAEHEEFGYFEVGLFLGASTELNRDPSDESQAAEGDSGDSTTKGAIGLELFYHGWKHFGAGILVEHAGEELDRDNTLILILGYYPSERIRLILSPGMESTAEGDNALLRFGGGYGFEIGKHWELVPEVNLDYIEGGKFTLVYGLTLSHPL